MNIIITRACMGARDLYNGVPNLLGAEVVDVVTEKESICTTLVLRTCNNQEFRISIKPAD